MFPSVCDAFILVFHLSNWCWCSNLLRGLFLQSVESPPAGRRRRMLAWDEELGVLSWVSSLSLFNLWLFTGVAMGTLMTDWFFSETPHPTRSRDLTSPAVHRPAQYYLPISRHPLPPEMAALLRHRFSGSRGVKMSLKVEIIICTGG